MLATTVSAQSIRVATFNVSMEAGNYIGLDATPSGKELFELLAKGEHQQIRNVAEIIQHVRPDIVLLNEFDYTANDAQGVGAFLSKFLSYSQQGAEAIDYPYFYVAPVNTGVESGVDLNHNGQSHDKGGDAFGFGLYPGQYGMALLSRYPIDVPQIRTFQHFLWKDMPGSLIDKVVNTDGKAWYSKEAKDVMRLSSKSHWDVPVIIGKKRLHILASHPTPPVFDGPENRNGLRNHDEVRFWVDYVGGNETARYIYDDQGKKGGFNGERFVLVGDLNASENEGDSYGKAIRTLLGHANIQDKPIPQGNAGHEHTPGNPHAKFHTAAWKMRVDYALPSKSGLNVKANGIFWPRKADPLYRLVENREASSDHRLVWVDVELRD